MPDEHRLRFRIGINVGDVMVKDGDIFGDGVNIAARLESLAEAGGICISRGVRDHVRKMGRFAFEDLGEQSVKNIDQPIRAFRLRGVDATAAPAPFPPATALPGAADHGSSDGPVLRQQASPADEAEFELTFWESIKDSQDPRSLRLTSRSIPTAPSPPWPRRAAARFWRRRGRRTRSPKLTRSSSLTGTR